MRRIFYLLALSLLVGSPRALWAQARQSGAPRSARDTLPERVVQRALDAFKRRDLEATFATYDTVFTHEFLGDPAGAKRVRRDDWLQQMKNDTGVVHTMNTWKVIEVRRDVFGPYVNDVWAFRTPDGKVVKHFELLEVRNGKIIREIEG
jgi:ketosteroid isomerase-like protein